MPRKFLLKNLPKNATVENEDKVVTGPNVRQLYVRNGPKKGWLKEVLEH